MLKRLGWLVVVGTVLVSGCNTMAGMGRDIEAGGDAIERSATRNR
jgi:predicted small secreted protein